MHNNNLREEIRQFQKRKTRFAVPIIVLGLLGLVLPVIPGLALLALGVMLLFPMQGRRLIERIRNYFRRWSGNRSKTREA